MSYTFSKKAKRTAIKVYHTLSIDKMLMYAGVGPLGTKTKKALATFLTNQEQQAPRLLHDLKVDMKLCYKKYLTNPDEYFLFGFRENKDEAYRASFLGDNFRLRTLIKVQGERIFVEELTDKMGFYALTKPYFRREVFKFTPSTPYASLRDYALRVQRLFIKLLSSSWGIGAMSVDIHDDSDCRELYSTLVKSGKFWIVEERILQHEKTAVWNASSVNTIRVPSFLSPRGFEIVQPFFRFGRSGSIVDNAGGGGIFAVVDVTTGKVATEGIDEQGHLYKTHPGSGLTFQGWQVPDWPRLKALVEEVHRTCMPHHRYIGWDFAYTQNGNWVLIEGNWGQFVGQYVDRIGVKDIFLRHMMAK